MRNATIRGYRRALKFGIGLLLLAFGASVWGQPVAQLESPTPDAFVESGIGLIRGWACVAERIDISINNGPPRAVAYGTRRADTLEVCGHPNTGFGLTFPWYALGEGVHNLKAFADGEEFADVNFTVAALGADFLPGLRGEYTLSNFPVGNRLARVRWSEPHQNFVFMRPLTIPPAPDVPDHPRVRLESPTQGSFESGIGLIRGWACAARDVRVSINGEPPRQIAYGARRADTLAVCGTADTGFGLTFPWYALGDGVHNLRAFVDFADGESVEFANVNFAVTTLGTTDFRRGLRRQQALADFPSPGQTTEIRWSEPHQNFVVAGSTAAGPKLGILSAIADRANRFAGQLASPAGQTDAIGMAAARDERGRPARVDQFAWVDAPERVPERVSADLDLVEGLPAVYRDSDGTEARLTDLTDTTLTVGFVRAGQPLAPPVTVEINGGFLRTLQNFIRQLQSEAQNVGNPPPGLRRLAAADPLATAATAARGFSLDARFVNLQWAGSVATGETLCAIERAAAATGILAQIAARACRSALVDSVLTLAQTRSRSSELPFDLIDPAVQAALRFEEDVPEAPCGPTDSNADCLASAVAEVQERQEDVGEPLPIEEPAPEPVLPDAPRNISATAGFYPDRVSVTWSAVANATRYEVYRSSSPTTTGVSIGSPTALWFDDFSVTAGTEYWYWVKTCNSVGCGEFGGPALGYAQPVQPTYNLTLNAAGTGSGAVAGAGRFEAGATVFLTANPNPDSTFAGWSPAPCAVSFLMPAQDLACTATFERIAPSTFTLSVAKTGDGDGEVTSSPAGISCGGACAADFEAGTLVTLTANPTGGSLFSGWGGACGGTGTCRVTMSQAQTVTATFIRAPSFFTLSVVKIGSGDGEVTSSPSGINCGGACAADFEAGTPVTLTANPASGSTFDGWGGACAGTGACTVAMNQRQDVTATFLRGGGGEVRVNLSWATLADLDLYVTDPCGNEIYFGNRSATCQGSTGTLDIDANASDPVLDPVENIFWSGSAPRGTYQVRVCYFPGRNEGPTAYQVLIQAGSASQTASGSLAFDECRSVASFNF